MDDQDGVPNDGEQEPGWARNLRKENERLKAEAAQAKAEVAATQREALFDRVGVPKDGPGALFRKAYDGDIAEDAIRAQATEFKVIETPRHTPLEEREVIDRANDALAGATNTQEFSDSLKSVEKQILEAKSSDEIDALLEQYNLEAS